MSKTVLFRMNGVSNAFLREFGCSPCAQCCATKKRANTSGSLIINDWVPPRGRIVHHLLFDCGSGVTDSLIDFGVASIASIFVSHSHPDHSLDLDRLANSYRRSGNTVPLSLYCTEATLADGPKRLYPWFFSGTNPILVHRPVIAGTKIVLGLGVNLTVTPVAVWHGNKAKDPVIWVIEFGELHNNTYHKIILGWDLLHLIPRYPHDDVDDSYSGSTNSLLTLDPSHEILANSDELFIEANTYTPCPKTEHISAEAVMRSIIPLLSPKRTWLVHYSGHEDHFGTLSDVDLQLKLNNNKVAYGLINHDLLVAQHGMVLSWVI